MSYALRLSAIFLAGTMVGCAEDPEGRDAGETEGIRPTTGPATSDGAATLTTTNENTSSGSSGGGCEQTCDDGECIDDVCCPAVAACGDICCGDSEVCSFQQCVAPGAECLDAGECGDDEYCEYSLGEPVSEGTAECQGNSLATGLCLPRPPECAEGDVPEGDDVDCLPACQVIPETSYAPELKYHWDLANSMMTPLVIQLDDDNCDDVVDARDIPEIVFATFEGAEYTAAGTLHAVSIIDGEVVEKWSIRPTEAEIYPGYSIAAGNIDNVPGNEIIACLTDGGAQAYNADGSVLWTSDYKGGCFMPSIADLDADGAPEVIFQNGVVAGATGIATTTLPGAAINVSVVTSDVDGDGLLEIVRPDAVFEADGSSIAATGLGGYHPAVADFDGDGTPEIATVVTANHTLAIWRPDPANPAGATILRSGVNINGTLGACSGDTGGGPPTIADFNGDGTPDVGVAAGIAYAVFDGAALLDPTIPNEETLLWAVPAVDCSSRQTGSSVFDFDGNGSAEVVYADQQYLRVFDGATGAVLFETCNTSGTLWEYPLVADVDNDGHADILAVANSYSSITCLPDGSQQRGLRIFGDSQGRWVRTRRIWNQHSYHVTNVEEDGTIPAVETPNWTVPGLNNFRQNVQAEGEFSAPDLVASIRPGCDPSAFGVMTTIRNIGRASVPADVPVTFYAGDPAAGGTLIGTMQTTKVLEPAEGEELVMMVGDEDIAIALRGGSTEAFVVIDEGNPVRPWTECRPENNTAHEFVSCTAG